MIQINIRMSSNGMINILDRIQNTLERPQAMYRDMGEYLTTSTQQRFRTSKAPDGSQWKTNSSAYLNMLNPQRQNKKPNILSHNLMNSIQYQINSGTQLRVGSNLIYAATMQFGAKKGTFGKGSPWGDIPARAFIGLSRDDEEELYLIAEEHLL